MKRLPGAVYHLARLVVGWMAFVVTGRTPPFAYQSMVSLFCRTRGVSNDIMSSVIRMVSRPYSIPSAEGLAGPLTPSDAAVIAREIEVKGYHVFQQRIPPEICQQLVARSLHMPARRLSGSEDDAAPSPFDPAHPEGAAYDCVPESVMVDDAVQTIISDESLMAVAQAYLRSAPVLSHVNLRWSAAQPTPDVEAAQFFHFDMERIKWIEFFVYLTDVDDETGPHEFVAGSHRTHGIPGELLRHGYSRLSDDDVRALYRPDDFVRFTGRAGMIIAEDSRGLHKGTALVKGQRLLFNFEFANSAFGSRSDRLPAPARVGNALRVAVARYPRVYAMLSR